MKKKKRKIMVFPAKSKTRQNQQKVFEKKKNQRKKFCHDFQSPDLNIYNSMDEHARAVMILRKCIITGKISKDTNDTLLKILLKKKKPGEGVVQQLRLLPHNSSLQLELLSV